MPDTDASVKQTSVHLTVSPVLYGIALRPDNSEHLRAAIHLACKWWGGMRFPWLTVEADGTVSASAETMCDELDVVGIIDLTRADDSTPPAAGLVSLNRNIIIGNTEPPLAMPIRAVAAPDPNSPLIRAADDTDGDFDPVAMINLGHIDDSECAAWEESGQGVATGANDSWLRSQPAQRTAVGITTTADDNFVISSAFLTSAALIWVLPDNFVLSDVGKDLCAFWNYRALRLRHRETVTLLTHLSSLDNPDVQRRLVEAISTTAATTPMCVFNGLAVGDEQLRTAAEALGFDVLDKDTTVTDRHFMKNKPIELTAVVNYNLASLWIGDRFTGASKDALAVAHSPSWQTRIDSPINWRYPYALQGLVSVRISSPEISGPRADAVAELFRSNSRWKADGIRVFDRATSVYRLTVGSPHPSEVLAAALADGKAKFVTSDKGREIEGVLATSQNLDLFRLPAFHALTNVLTPHPSPRVQHALEGLTDKIAKSSETVALADELRNVVALAKPRRYTLEELVNYPSIRMAGIGRDAVSTVLTEMVAYGLARWGFECRCTLCGLEELTPLTAAKPVPQCTGCGREAAYTTRNDEPALYYSLTSLLERVSRNAGLTPLAAAAALRKSGYYLVAGADIFLGDNKSETDLLGWHNDRLLTGEAKAAAKLFNADAVVRDIECASEIGATTYLLACPEIIDGQVIKAALESGVKHGLEILQLIGPHLTSGMPPTLCVLDAPRADSGQ